MIPLCHFYRAAARIQIGVSPSAAAASSIAFGQKRAALFESIAASADETTRPQIKICGSNCGMTVLTLFTAAAILPCIRVFSKEKLLNFVVQPIISLRCKHRGSEISKLRLFMLYNFILRIIHSSFTMMTAFFNFTLINLAANLCFTV